MLDDDGFMLGVLSRMLQGMGYGRVDTASCAQDALHRLQPGTVLPDLVICDLNMPGMDGIEFLQRLNDSGFRGSLGLLSGEGMRIMHTVQKLLGGGGLVILRALEKPAGRAALQAVLGCWRPLAPVPEVRSKPDIQLAEELGAIDTLTDWVLGAALAQLASWQAGGLKLHMAVNLSMDNLRAPGFASKVGEYARRCRVAPQDVVLEITESRLMLPLAAPLESLVRLRLQRFQLSIDDFGTGHSSLAQLRDVPFTELKVDRGFVHGARHNQITRPMLEGSLAMARRLALGSVAEGVETEDDWHLLRELDCDLAQGWFIGRAVPAGQLSDWLRQRQLRVAHLIAS